MRLGLLRAIYINDHVPGTRTVVAAIRPGNRCCGAAVVRPDPLRQRFAGGLFPITAADLVYRPGHSQNLAVHPLVKHFSGKRTALAGRMGLHDGSHFSLASQRRRAKAVLLGNRYA